MILMASLFFNLLVFIFFRKAPINDQERPAVIAFNYVAATTWAWSQMSGNQIINPDLGRWLPFALVLGILFIGTFIAISKSVSMNGMSITAATGKMSLVIPMILMSMVSVTGLHYGQIIALVLALAGIYFQSDRKQSEQKLHWGLLALVFLGGGVIDSLFSWVSHHGMPATLNSSFNAIIFGISGILGFIYLAWKRPQISWVKVIFLGIILGSVNFWSVQCYLTSLTPSVSGYSTPTSLGINNIGQVLGAAVLGFIIWKEPFHKGQIIGLICCLISLLMLGYYGSV
jgi:hypothetical protein